MPEVDEIKYPDILFKIADSLYSVSSRHVISISTLPKYNSVPGAAEGVSGIIKFREEVIPIIDMRVIFGIPTLQQEYQEFVKMLDDRKNDHINWVDELDRSFRARETFKLAKDPHQCAFGKWYDKFQTDSQIVDFHMKKIAEPHSKLHAMAYDMDTCDLEATEVGREDCSEQVIGEIKSKYMPSVLELLEEAKTVFENSYREMLIILKNKDTQIGMVVDEVLSIEELKEVSMDEKSLSFNHSEYINTAKEKDGTEELILSIDEYKLLDRYSNIQTEGAELPQI